VDCVAQLGGLHDAQQALRRHMSHQLRLVVSKALDCFPASQRLPPGDYLQQQQHLQQQQQAAASPSGQADISVPPEVAATAQALLEHILGCCSQVGSRSMRGTMGDASVYPVVLLGWLATPSARTVPGCITPTHYGCGRTPLLCRSSSK
jgi:hypothetical protein